MNAYEMVLLRLLQMKVISLHIEEVGMVGAWVEGNANHAMDIDIDLAKILNNLLNGAQS